MNRETAKELTLDYINGHLSPEERLQIEEFLRSDNSFRREFESARRELFILRNSLNDPREDDRISQISEGVMTTIRKKRDSSLYDLSPAWRSYMRAAAAVVLVVIGLVFIFLLSPNFRESSSTQLAVEPQEQSPAVGETTTRDDEPDTIHLSFATSNPKVKIYWTLSKNFEL